MSTILSIAGTEARRIFVSPLAWAVLAVIQFILGVFFILLLAEFSQNAQVADQSLGLADYISGGLYNTANIILLLVMPLMTMRLFAEERRSGSLTLLLSAPVSLIEIVLGKFLGLSVFILATLALLLIMPLSLLPASPIDLARIGAGLLGMFLMMLAFGAAGLFISTLTREPVIAAVISFGLLLIIFILQGVADMNGAPFPELIRYLSMTSHFENLRRGIFNSADLVYYLLFTALFLWLAVLRLDMERN